MYCLTPSTAGPHFMDGNTEHRMGGLGRGSAHLSVSPASPPESARCALPLFWLLEELALAGPQVMLAFPVFSSALLDWVGRMVPPRRQWAPQLIGMNHPEWASQEAGEAYRGPPPTLPPLTHKPHTQRSRVA